MRDVTVIDVRRRAPAVLVLLALLALLVSVCHGTHGHHPLSAPDATTTAPGATTTVTAPALPHGCERPGDTWSFDVHLPAQTVPRPTAPDAARPYSSPTTRSSPPIHVSAASVTGRDPDPSRADC